MMEGSRFNHTTARLRILQTTDLHMCLMPFDYVSNRSGGNYGLARLAPKIAALRQDDVATLLFDTGDFLQGNQLGSYVIENMHAGTPHPMIAAMNVLEYDAITLGNHDFDFGLPKLTRALSALECSVALANLTMQGAPVFQPYCMIPKEVACADGQTRTLTIGVIGFVTPQTVFEQPRASTHMPLVEDIPTAAAEHAPKLRAAGADVIVALCHCGIGPNDHVHGAINAALALAKNPDIDVLLTGHVHDIFPDPHARPSNGVDPARGSLHGKPSTMAGAFASHLGQIDLKLAYDDGAWTVQDHQSAVIAAADIDEKPEATAVAIASTVNTAHHQTLAHMATPIANTAQPIHSYFAQIHADHSLRLLADAKFAIFDDILNETPFAHLPRLAAVAPYRAGGRAGPNHFVDIPTGGMTLRDMGAMYPFASRLSAFVSTGADLRERLEHAAKQFCQLTVGTHDQPLFDPDFAAYNADTVFGVTYQIDLTRPAGSERIQDLRYNGVLVQDNAEFVIIANSFRRHGGGGYKKIADHQIIHSTPLPFHDLLVAYLRRRALIKIDPTPVWSFTSLANTTAIFQSSPRAAAHLDALTYRTAKAGARRDDGFCDYTLFL
jgi:2',3'-cyclic-nucleotide 2'-phosphodiesterase/3'-nucleotidase